MLARTLTLECPRGQTGHETISHEGPTRLPEARRAIQSGQAAAEGRADAGPARQPVRADAARRDAGGGRREAAAAGEDVTDARAKLDERADQLRHLVETLDLLYDAFGQRRFGKEWADTLGRMQKWLSWEERRAA